MDSSGQKRTVTLQRNPLLIRPVMKCVFEYLPLKDLKQCRVVCHEWKSVVTQMLNKQSEVKLYSNERIKNFLEFYKANDTKPFPFTTFCLEICHQDGDTEKYEKLLDLFNTLRENIVTLRFGNHKDKLYITPLIEIATNLVGLTISSNNTVVQLNKLTKVKYLILIGCCVSLDSFENRIAPLSISLKFVTFQRNGNALQEILINDYIDFSRCSEIILTATLTNGFVLTFDMSRDIVSARKVELLSLRVINWTATPPSVDQRMLFYEKQTTEMEIKELDFRSSELNLSALPKSIEKLSLFDNTYGTIDCVPIELPNLKCLIFRPAFNDTADTISPTIYDMDFIISTFRLCPKLVDMELKGICFYNLCYDINVDLMPITLKRIKLSNNKKINLVGDAVIHVDTLILDRGTFADAQKFMNQIKPKILVIQLQSLAVENPVYEIVSFVEESRNLEKIVVKIPDDGANRIRRSYKRALSTYVDDDGESNFYAFTNEIGESLTKEEFKMYWF